MRRSMQAVEGVAVSGFEGVTVQELCEWANSLGVCEFEVADKFGEGRVVAGRGKVSIELSLGRFSDGVPDIGGNAYVSIDWRDRRDGFSGGGLPCETWAELEREVANRATGLGLATGQLRMF